MPLRKISELPRAVEWTLRIGAFMCFVGHGAFGIITKEAWVRYFAVIGIGHDLAYTLMPIVGLVDIAMGFFMLLLPTPAVAWWMIGWAIWTALLRPLSGEPGWEAIERAGNYGVPAALLVTMTHGRDWKGLFKRGFRALPLESVETMRRILTGAVALLLLGHGALGVMHKAALTTNYASVMPASVAMSLTPWLGWFEIILAVAVAFRPSVTLLLFVAAWKLVTEALFVSAGAPVWEFVERGGSYAAPVALAILSRRAATSRSPLNLPAEAFARRSGLLFRRRLESGGLPGSISFVRRSAMLRVILGLWGLWFTGTYLEVPALHACQVHAPAAAAHAAGTPAAAHEHHHAAQQSSTPQEHHGADCTCLGSCCSASPVALAVGEPSPVVGIVATRVRATVAEQIGSSIARPHERPFANAPPVA